MSKRNRAMSTRDMNPQELYEFERRNVKRDIDKKTNSFMSTLSVIFLIITVIAFFVFWPAGILGLMITLSLNKAVDKADREIAMADSYDNINMTADLFADMQRERLLEKKKADEKAAKDYEDFKAWQEARNNGN